MVLKLIEYCLNCVFVGGLKTHGIYYRFTCHFSEARLQNVDAVTREPDCLFPGACEHVFCYLLRLVSLNCQDAECLLIRDALNLTEKNFLDPKL